MFTVYLGLAADYRIRHIRTPEGGGRGGGRERFISCSCGNIHQRGNIIGTDGGHNEHEVTMGGFRFLCLTWRACTLGGFNVSNLMGITRRMIDIGKKITFYFLQNV
jgi:hypothetical protein